jgi:hypothetical protein
MTQQKKKAENYSQCSEMDPDHRKCSETKQTKPEKKRQKIKPVPNSIA